MQIEYPSAVVVVVIAIAGLDVVIVTTIPQAVNIRCTIVKMQQGGLFVYAPVAPTMQFLKMVKDLESQYGPVKFVIEPTYGIEHKVFAGPFSRAFPDAKVFVPPGM